MVNFQKMLHRQSLLASEPRKVTITWQRPGGIEKSNIIDFSKFTTEWVLTCEYEMGIMCFWEEAR